MPASLTVFEKEHAAREKYIYFVCGLAGALFAYVGKDYFPVQPLDCAAKLTLVALVSLTLCLAFGMARIQFYIEGLSVNRDVLVADEELINLRNSRLKQKTVESNYTVNHKTGKEYTTIEELDEDIKAIQTKRNIDFSRMGKLFLWSTGLFIICHCFLALGFILLIYAKLVG